MRPSLHLALCISSVLSASSMHAQSLAVTQVEPARHRTDASTAAVITVNFDAPLDAASVSPNSVKVWGRWSGVVPGVRSVSGSTLRFQPSRPFFPGETVSVAMTSALRSASGDVLIGGHSFSFWVRSAPGSTNFELDQIKDIRFPGEGLIQSYGAYAGDLNGDGVIDLSIPNEVAADVRVMLGDGCGDYSTPTSYPLPPGAFPGVCGTLRTAAIAGASCTAIGSVASAVFQARSGLPSMYRVSRYPRVAAASPLASFAFPAAAAAPVRDTSAAR